MRPPPGGLPDRAADRALKLRFPRLRTRAAAFGAAMTGVLLGSGPAASADAGLQPIPGLHEEVVLHGAIVNGRRLHLNRFVDQRPPEVLRQAVEASWERRPAPLHGFARDGWLVLVQAVGPAFETIEIRARAAGSEGRRSLLSRPDPDAGAISRWLDEALPPGSRVLDRITHRDGNRRMTTVVAMSALSADALSRSMLAELGRQGFATRPRHMPSFSGVSGQVQFLARGREDLALTISEQGGERAIVMHWGRTVP